MWHPKRHQGRRGRGAKGAIVAALSLAVTLSAASCDSSSPLQGSSGRVQVQLKDFPLEALASAEVWISRVYLVGGAEGKVDLLHDEDNPRHYDLLDLREGVTADLTEPVLVADEPYAQLRLVVDSAHIELSEGNTFTDGSSTRVLFVASGEQSGIKVQLEKDLEVEEGSTTIVLVDFDVAQSFVFQGSIQAGFHGVLFTPVLKEEARSVEEED